MIKYREHRGSLIDSLATAKKFNSIKELLEFIIENSHDVIFIKDLQINYYGIDERCNQELYTVSAPSIGVFGFIYEEIECI